MSADKESSQKRWSERIGELGPAWITAIVGLCALFVGGGYAAGHASGAPDPAPQPTVTVTATATATVTSPVTQSQQSPHASRTAKSNDAALGSYTIELPSGYSIPLLFDPLGGFKTDAVAIRFFSTERRLGRFG